MLLEKEARVDDDAILVDAVAPVVVAAAEATGGAAGLVGNLSVFAIGFLGDKDKTEDENLTQGLFPNDPISEGVRSAFIRVIGI